MKTIVCRPVLLGVFCAILPATLFADTTNVAKVGADPTGSHDSTAAIQSALDQGGTIFFPRGLYKITKTLRITKPETCLRGEHGAIIWLAPGKIDTALAAKLSKDEDIWKLRNIHIEGLTFRNDPKNYRSALAHNAGQGIFLHGVADVGIDNCRIEDFVHDGILVWACKDVRITDTRVIGGRHGITVNGSWESGRYGTWNVQIDNCHTSDTWDTGIVIAYFSHHVTVSNCLVERSKCHGVDIFHVEDVALTGNVIKNWLDTSVKAGGHPEQAVGVFIHTDLLPDVPTKNIVVTGNVIMREPHPPKIRPVCVEVHGNVEAVNITGNIVIGGTTAFAVGPCGNVAESSKHPLWTPRDILFASNVCRGQTAAWLYIRGYSPAMPVLVTDNLFAPKDTTCFLGEQTKGVVFSGNMFLSGRFPESLPGGIVWGKNYGAQGVYKLPALPTPLPPNR